MFTNAIAKLPNNYGILKTLCPAAVNIRHGHRIRGKPHGIAKTIEQRLECKLRLCLPFFHSSMEFLCICFLELKSLFQP